MQIRFKSAFLCGLTLLFVFITASLSQETEWSINPGVTIGKITAKTTEEELIKNYGKENVKSENIHIGEGHYLPGTILFPDQPEKKLEILWKDSKIKRNPDRIIIDGANKKTLWKTVHGITLGVSLKELEKVNSGPFLLAGFGWDGGGMMGGCNGGKLENLGYCSVIKNGKVVTRAKISIRFSPNPVNKYEIVNKNGTSMRQLAKDYVLVSGDKEFLSSNPTMQKINPVISRMEVLFD